VQNLAFILIALGLLVLIGWLAKDFFMADEISVFIRIAVGIIAAAVLMLFGIAIKDRIAQSKKDDFEGVDN
jgi:uncharacterized membrane protein YeaQ/YmgE (transglycosylase-associated protein family)|tara:strand:+ start:488 stop:700 length:213 start_codon:yes stop_codon:yes gene_type:complete